MGAPKLCLPLAGRPVVAHALDSARGAGLPVLGVTGAHRTAILDALGTTPSVHAADSAQGLSRSLAAGIDALPPEWRGVLILLGDMPFVRPATLGLLARTLEGGAPAVVPVHRGRRGNPAGFSRALLPRLAALEGDRGAGPLLDRLGVVEVIVDDPGVIRDIDRPSDLAAARAALED